MPGVLIIEAMAQTGGLLTLLSRTEPCSSLFYMVKVDNARFNKMVVPGDRLDMEVELKRLIRNMAVYNCVAKVDGQLVASAEVLCAEDRDN
jgi:3-hydroxyacyl-[acyl-carrier-protein] dehydratase